MVAIPTARERARGELTRAIKEEARRQIAAEGAQRLSLRAVARELGVVSSALYRYFASRDELLTALIIDAYGALADRLEKASAGFGHGRADARGRWRALCGGVRDWAREHPHEYALIYGTPIPGYQAPRTTVSPAARVIEALAGVVREVPTAGDGELGRALPGRVGEQMAGTAALVAPGVPGSAMSRALIAWTQLFGMVNFELFGHLVGSVDPADDFFAHAVEEMADYLGLAA
ncbi:TetR/AcrR family transcriptional regulator [Streptomyces sp. NPDC051453]|uniref:TetR/AcrR family transcriptional regulator n=1 Tax=Streptomyces sp. NPDC051453 TaxID=3154941 RepID=UPI003414C369